MNLVGTHRLRPLPPLSVAYCPASYFEDSLWRRVLQANATGSAQSITVDAEHGPARIRAARRIEKRAKASQDVPGICHLRALSARPGRTQPSRVLHDVDRGDVVLMANTVWSSLFAEASSARHRSPYTAPEVINGAGQPVLCWRPSGLT